MTLQRVSIVAVIVAVVALVLGALGFSQAAPLRADLAALQESAHGSEAAVRLYTTRTLPARSADLIEAIRRVPVPIRPAAKR